MKKKKKKELKIKKLNFKLKYFRRETKKLIMDYLKPQKAK